MGIAGIGILIMSAQGETGNEDIVWLPVSRRLRILYLVYLLIVVWVVLVPLLILLTVSASSRTTLLVSLLALLLVFVAMSCIRWYVRSIRYGLGPGGIHWQRGVWFRKQGILPFYCITDVTIVRGPLTRLIGISTLRIRSSGKDCPGAMNLTGLEKPEDARSAIMEKVGGQPGISEEDPE
jgi:uncharacterized protein